MCGVEMGLAEKEDIAKFKLRIWISAILSLVLPPLLGVVVLVFLGVYDLEAALKIFVQFTGVYFGICILFLYHYTNSFLERTISKAEGVRLGQESADFSFIKRLPYLFFVVMLLYFIGGVITANLSMHYLQGYDFDLAFYGYSLLGVLPAVLITQMVIFFYLTDGVGEYLASRGVILNLVPVWLKILILGLVTPILIDTILLIYFRDRTGFFVAETVVLWAVLLAVAATGTLLALNSIRKSLAPLKKPIEANGEENNIDLSGIVPRSLDEIGILAAGWKSLCEKVGQQNEEIKQHEKVLRRERDFTNAVLESAGALVVVLNKDGSIERFNRACEMVTGYRQQDVYGRHVWDFLLTEDQVEDVRAVFSHLVEEAIPNEYVNYWVARSGEKRMISWANTILHGEQGDVSYVISIGVDITEEYAAKRQLQIHQEQLEELVAKRTRQLEDAQDELVNKERLATLGQLTATVSHELRNPLGAIKPSLYILKKNLNLSDSKVHDALERIDRGIKRCDHIIDELLDYTRIRDLELEDVALDAWLSGVVSDQDISADIKLRLDLGLGGRTVAIDPGRMRRAVINVVENACQAMQHDGQRGEARFEGILTITTKLERGRCEIRVSDTGYGIAPEVLQRVFEPLYSTKGFGVGLGMSTVKQIMEQHGGGIELHSRQGMGTEVILWLPGADRG